MFCIHHDIPNDVQSQIYLMLQCIKRTGIIGQIFLQLYTGVFNRRFHQT